MKNNGVPDELIEIVYENLNPTQAEKEMFEKGFFLMQNQSHLTDREWPRMYKYGRSDHMDKNSTINKVIIHASDNYEAVYQTISLPMDDVWFETTGEMIETDILIPLIHRIKELRKEHNSQ